MRAINSKYDDGMIALLKTLHAKRTAIRDLTRECELLTWAIVAIEEKPKAADAFRNAAEAMRAE